ncbi:MAG TPA: DUF5694 domain-containing protein [Caulobacteraceae bacterium]
MRFILALFVLALAPAAVLAAVNVEPHPGPAPVEVMIVGGFHMANPGRDLHNLQVDDVLAPRRQAEIAAVTGALARFRPTKVAVEDDAADAAQRWAKYRAGTLPPSRNEVIQLGFRLARTAGLDTVYGIDVEGDFPFEPVQAWATAHGKSALLDRQGMLVDQRLAVESRILKEKSVGALLRHMNQPALLASDNDFYRTTLFMGEGATQPGADLLTAWYHRNFMICANLLQLSKPGDRIVVFYGSGHAFLLRQCVAETPGFRLVEPDVWLPG